MRNRIASINSSGLMRTLFITVVGGVKAALRFPAVEK